MIAKNTKTKTKTKTQKHTSTVKCSRKAGSAFSNFMNALVKHFGHFGVILVVFSVKMGDGVCV